MKRLPHLLALALCLGLVACKSTGRQLDETPTRGTATVLVDESFYPMVEGQAQVFQSLYKYAKLNVLMQPEQEVAHWLVQDSSRIVVLSRDLTEAEQAYFEGKKIIPRINDVGYDGIALITSKLNKDTAIGEDALKQLLQGKANPKGYTLVFDNSRSSTVQHMKAYAGVENLSNAYSFNSTAELIKYVADHRSSIGFVGVNWLYEPDSLLQPQVAKVKMLGISTAQGTYKPTQNDVALGAYPLIRKIRIVNVQGAAGLGLGFATFMAGDVGQRIVLKAGLVPSTYPKREIIVRNQKTN